MLEYGYSTQKLGTCTVSFWKKDHFLFVSGRTKIYDEGQWFWAKCLWTDYIIVWLLVLIVNYETWLFLRGFIYKYALFLVYFLIFVCMCYFEMFHVPPPPTPLQNSATSGTANRRPRSSRRAVPTTAKSRARSSSPKSGPWVPAPGKATRGSRITWQVLEGGCHGNSRLHPTKKRVARSRGGSKVGYDFMSPSSSSSFCASSCQLLLTSFVLLPWFLVHVDCWDRGEDVGVACSTCHTVDTGHLGEEVVWIMRVFCQLIQLTRLF